MSSSNNNSAGIDKEFLYGKFQRAVDWQQKLAKKASYKALDIAEDDVNINANKTGIGALGAIGIALAAGLPSMGMAGLLAYSMLGDKPETTAPTPEKIIETVTETIGVRA